MSSTYTASNKFAKPATNDTGWGTTLNADLDQFDALTPVGSLAVSLAEVPSASLNVSVSSGRFRASTGLRVAYAGVASFTVTASVTTCLWLTDAGVLASGSAFPADSVPHVRLATIVAGATTITSVADGREPWTSEASPLTSGANQAAIADGSGGTASFAIATIADAPTANAIASLARQVAALRAALIASGAIKGGA